jgi:hypothetical protein
LSDTRRLPIGRRNVTGNISGINSGGATTVFRRYDEILAGLNLADLTQPYERIITSFSNLAADEGARYAQANTEKEVIVAEHKYTRDAYTSSPHDGRSEASAAARCRAIKEKQCSAASKRHLRGSRCKRT